MVTDAKIIRFLRQIKEYTLIFQNQSIFLDFSKSKDIP